MSTSSRQAELLGLFEKTREALLTFASSRTPTQTLVHGTYDQWAAKDLLTNIAFWMQYMVERMAIYARGEIPPRHVDFEALNQNAFEMHKARSWQDSLNDAQESLSRLIIAVRESTEEQLNVTNGYGEVSDDNPGGPLSGEIRANGFLYPLQELEKFYDRAGDPARVQAVHRTLHESIEASMNNADLITAQALCEQQRADEKPLIVDVRGPQEYAAGHISGAVNIPLTHLAKILKDLPQDQPIVTYCNMHHPGESRGEQAAAQLREKGYRAQALKGGFPGWKEAGHATEEATDL